MNSLSRRGPEWSGAGGILDFRAYAPAGLANMTQISERLLVQAHLDAKQPKPLTPEQEAEYRAAIAAEHQGDRQLISEAIDRARLEAIRPVQNAYRQNTSHDH